MRVLVTGGTGFVGRHLVACLLDRGHQVTVVGRDATRAISFSWGSRVRFVSHDLRDPVLAPCKAFGEIDAVAHLAWSGLPNYKDLFHFEENLPVSYRFLKTLVEAKVSRILVTGTCFEYGMQSGCLLEDGETRPSNPYGLAKDTLRKFLESLQRHTSFQLLWTRLFYLYGEGQNPRSLLAQLDQAIANGEPQFKMSGGEQIRDYLSVTQVAKQLAIMLEHAGANGIFNVCSGTPVTVRALVENRIDELGAKIELDLGYYPYPDYEPFAFWGSNKKFQSLGVQT